MAVGIQGGSKILIEVKPQNFLPLKGVTAWSTGGGERSSTPRQHLNDDDGTLNQPGDPSPFTIDIGDATAVQTHITWKTLLEAYGDPSSGEERGEVNVALLADGKAQKTFTTAGEVGVIVAVTGSDYTSQTGKYHGMGLVTLSGSLVGAGKSITRLSDAAIETGKQIEIGTQILSVVDIVSDTNTSKTFRVYNPNGSAVTAVGTPTGFKAGNPVECFGLTVRNAPTGFPCHVLQPGTPSRTTGEPRIVSAQLGPVNNRLPAPTLIAFQS